MHVFGVKAWCQKFYCPKRATSCSKLFVTQVHKIGVVDVAVSSILDDAMDVAWTAPQEAHCSAHVIYSLP